MYNEQNEDEKKNIKNEYNNISGIKDLFDYEN